MWELIWHRNINANLPKGIHTTCNLFLFRLWNQARICKCNQRVVISKSKVCCLTAERSHHWLAILWFSFVMKYTATVSVPYTTVHNAVTTTSAMTYVTPAVPRIHTHSHQPRYLLRPWQHVCVHPHILKFIQCIQIYFSSIEKQALFVM